MDKLQLLAEYEQEYKRVNNEPITIKHVGGGWYRLIDKDGHDNRFNNYRLKDISEMLTVLQQRPDGGKYESEG